MNRKINNKTNWICAALTHYVLKSPKNKNATQKKEPERKWRNGGDWKAFAAQNMIVPKLKTKAKLWLLPPHSHIMNFNGYTPNNNDHLHQIFDQPFRSICQMVKWLRVLESIFASVFRLEQLYRMRLNDVIERSVLKIQVLTLLKLCFSPEILTMILLIYAHFPTTNQSTRFLC